MTKEYIKKRLDELGAIQLSSEVDDLSKEMIIAFISATRSKICYYRLIGSKFTIFQPTSPINKELEIILRKDTAISSKFFPVEGCSVIELIVQTRKETEVFTPGGKEDDYNFSELTSREQDLVIDILEVISKNFNFSGYESIFLGLQKRNYLTFDSIERTRVFQLLNKLGIDLDILFNLK